MQGCHHVPMPPKRRWKSRDPEDQAAADAAESEIRQLRAAVEAASAQLVRRRAALAEGIARHVQAQAITQAEAARAADYEARTISRIVREAGVPHVRPDAAERARQRAADPQDTTG